MNSSVVIVTYNTGPILFRCVECVLSQDGLHELIIVDNGNPEDISQRLLELSVKNQNIRVVSGHGNIGFAKACNLGASRASAEYVLFLNPDCLLQKDALVNTAKILDSYPDVSLAGCKLLRPDGSPQGGSRRNLLSPKIALSQVFKLYKWFGLPQINLPETDDSNVEYVPAISGAFMFMRKKEFGEIGGFDEEYFFHVEDLDLCKSIAEKGNKIIYIPHVKTVHYLSSSKASSFFVERHKTAGFIHYFSKFYKGKMNPVFLALIKAGIYLRLAMKLPLLLIRQKYKDLSYARREIIKQRQIKWLKKEVERDPELSTVDFIRYRVILTGATGQVGLSILRRLLDSGVKTCGVFHNQLIDYNHRNLKWIHGDIESGFIDDFKEFRPTTLVHTPAIWHLPALLPYFAQIGVKHVVCFSSTSVDGKANSKNKYEQELVQKFINSEKDIARICKENGMTYNIFRPTMIYGCGLDKNVSSIARFVKIFGFFPISMPGRGLRQPVHVDDLAKSVLRVMVSPTSINKIYNLSGATQLTYRDMVNRISALIGKPRSALRIPFLAAILNFFSVITGNKDTNGEIAKRMNRNLVFDHAAATTDIGYSPRPFLQDGREDLGLNDERKVA